MKLAIVGYGIEGEALAQYFSLKDNDITVCDINKKDIKLKNIHKRLGQHYLENIDEFDMIFRSPGVPLLPEFKSVQKKLTSLTKYFFKNCPCPIIGITGTKGKGTTASLIYEMVKAGTFDRKVFLGGNIGQSLLKNLDQLKPKDIVILELSSFQLQDIDQSPHIAVVLGISPDHLDHHKTMGEYIEAKKNIIKYQTAKDFAVLDADNETALMFRENAKSTVFQVSIQKPVDEGAFVKVGSFIFKHGKSGTIFGEKSQMKLLGDHNIKNILAAATVANILKIPVDVIAKVIREFPGLPHRLEFVKQANGVRYYNDSASTNPETAIAALRVFSEPTILIVGGSDKNTDFASLGREIIRRLNVKSVIVMGETKGKIESAIEEECKKEEKKTAKTQAEIGRPIRRRDIPLEIITAENYQEAFMVAKFLSQPGDVVLFSPACASFDMFKNYQERGEIFRSFIMDLDL